MHELAIAESVLSTIIDRVGERRVHSVRLEIGQLSGVSAEALRFCFELASVGTGLEQAQLEILEPPGRGRCRTCREEFTVQDHILLCSCGSSDVTLMTGDELRVLSVEVIR
ncbi:hydrogenase maturation nickel metallochaperone HypA [Jatrophihabitans telluris]|uniref:Hydrogenase maturation factor HypA n=1 Tax=Jatrophihabitans telluris TaxID=2038343 RepID=A0ABY4R380_9ACTN|nr:hydrogenase maturation nickel metallochaperone HypA [Jatrophihabitans telluris]UQX89484.1 hydrogenase maturation nickel metallochaperone HypA [Jatrophihabitans telluris]